MKRLFAGHTESPNAENQSDLADGGRLSWILDYRLSNAGFRGRLES
jgi:hypothetical protein